MATRRGLGSMLVLLSAAAAPAWADAPALLRAPPQAVALPGDGSWDYVTYDPSHDRVFIGRFDGVQVVAAGDGRSLATIGAPTGDHGVAIAPQPDRVFTSDARERRLGVFALSTLQHVADVALPGEPDGLLFDPASGTVLAFVPDAKRIVAIESATGRVAGELDVAGEPESGVADGAGSVFVTIRDTGEILKLDVRAMAVTARWKAACERPTPITMDAARGRLFVGCRDRRMLVLDAADGRLVASLPTGEGTDAATFDPQHKLVVLANGGGSISLIREAPDDRYVSIGQIEMPRGARTMALDPGGDRLFTVTADILSVDPPTARHPYPRLHPAPGTFRMIVLRPAV